VIALLAALSMVGQDLTLTLMVMAENRDAWWLAGLLDTAGYLLTLATLHWSLGALQHGWTSEAVQIVAAVSIANFFGTGGGVIVGKRWIKNPVKVELEQLRAALVAQFPEVADRLDELKALAR
jgi:hypothetical protein